MFSWCTSHRCTVSLDASVEELFEFLSSPYGHGVFVGAVGPVTEASDGPMTVGSYFKVIREARIPRTGEAYGVEVKFEVIDCVPRRRLAYRPTEALSDDIHVVHYFEFESLTSNRTEVTKGVRTEYGWLTKVVLYLTFPVSAPIFLLIAAVYKPLAGSSTLRELRKLAHLDKLRQHILYIAQAAAEAECPHFVLVPRWDTVGDIGNREKVTRYECQSCKASFGREDGERIQSEGLARGAARRL